MLKRAINATDTNRCLFSVDFLLTSVILLFYDNIKWIVVRGLKRAAGQTTIIVQINANLFKMQAIEVRCS